MGGGLGGVEWEGQGGVEWEEGQGGVEWERRELKSKLG